MPHSYVGSGQDTFSQPAIACLKLTIRNTKTRYEIRSTLTTKIPDIKDTRYKDIVNFEHILHLTLVFLLLTLSR